MDFDARDFEEDDPDDRRMAMDDRCWDGSWLASGLHGMLVDLSQPDFCEEELEEYTISCGEVTMEDEFLTFPEFDDFGRIHEQEWRRMHQEILEPRQLHLLRVQELLNEEEEMFSKDKDWNLYIRSLKSRCR